MKANELQEHVFATYLTLRYGMAVLALAFPTVLYGIGKFYDIQLQHSMSHYYFAAPANNTADHTFPMRALFAGGHGVRSFIIIY